MYIVFRVIMTPFQMFLFPDTDTGFGVHGACMFSTVYSGSYHGLSGMDSVVWKHETISISTEMLSNRKEDARASRGYQ